MYIQTKVIGVPITIIYNKKTLEPLIDKDLNKILKFIKDKVDAWFDEPVSSLDKKFDTNEYEKVTDILDVWFDSGSAMHLCLNILDSMIKQIYI